MIKLFIRVCDTEDDMTGVEIQNINVDWYLKEDFYHKIYDEDDDLVMMFEEEQIKVDMELYFEGAIFDVEFIIKDINKTTITLPTVEESHCHNYKMNPFPVHFCNKKYYNGL